MITSYSILLTLIFQPYADLQKATTEGDGEEVLH
jgi:hypothetical protein